MEFELYKRPWQHSVIRSLWWIVKPLNKILVLIYAISGKYPWWMVTPDDPISPFGSATVPGASREPTVMKVYEKFGRYIGDVYWLGWRNSTYGLTYWMKPAFLKDSNIKYEDLNIVKQDNNVYVKTPDGTWLRETTRKYGPFYLITGYRLTPILEGQLENLERLRQGLPRAPRPAYHPNMDGRPIVSIRTARTM